MAGYGVLAGLLGGLGGFTQQTAAALEQERRDKLVRDKLDQEQQYRDAQITLERDKLAQSGPINVSTLPPQVQAVLTQAGAPKEIDPRLLPMYQKAGEEARTRSQSGQMANAIEGMFPPNDVQGPTRSGEPIGLQPTIPSNMALLVNMLRNGGQGENLKDVLAQAFQAPELKEVQGEDGATYYQPFNKMTGAPVPGSQRTLKSPGELDVLRRMGILPPTSDPAAGAAPGNAAGTPAAPTAGPATLPGYQQPDLSFKVGNATVAMKPRDVTNAYSASAFFASNGRTTDLQTLAPEERVVAQRLYQQGETRNPDLLVASYLQSGDPAQADLAERYLQIQKEREAGNAAAVEKARVRATPLSDTAQAALGQHTNLLANIRQLKTFSPEEVAAFTGLVNRPLAEAKQMLAGIPGLGMNPDERFAEYQTVLGRLKGTAFGEGGKQLTPFEASVVFSYTPSGDERNAQQVIQKVRYLEAFTSAARDLRLEMAKSGRSDLDPTQFDALLQQRLQGAGIPVPKEAAGWSGPASAPPTLGQPGYTGRVTQPDMPQTPPKPGRVWIRAPDGVWGQWDASKPIPQGYMR